MRCSLEESHAERQRLRAVEADLLAQVAEAQSRAPYGESDEALRNEEGYGESADEGRGEREGEEGEVVEAPIVPRVVWEGWLENSESWLEKAGRRDLTGKVSQLVPSMLKGSGYQWRYVVVSDKT